MQRFRTHALSAHVCSKRKRRKDKGREGGFTFHSTSLGSWKLGGQKECTHQALVSHKK